MSYGNNIHVNANVSDGITGPNGQIHVGRSILINY